MKIDIFKVPQAEMDILNILWDSKKPLTTALLSKTLQKKPATINTLAGRLTKKGLIIHVGVNSHNLYLPLIRKEDYQFFVAKLLVDTLFNGSIAELFSSLLMDAELSRETLESLKSLVNYACLPVEETEAEGHPENPPKNSSENSSPATNPSLFSLPPANHRPKKRRQRTSRIPRAA